MGIKRDFRTENLLQSSQGYIQDRVKRKKYNKIVQQGDMQGYVELWKHRTIKQ